MTPATQTKEKKMKIINQTNREKPTLPKGKISVRWVHSRVLYQAYAGGRYLSGAVGSTEEEALSMVHEFYKA